MQVLFAPFDVLLAEDSMLQPDLLVAARADFTEQDLPVAPLLAVEILSPSTRQIDLTLKRARDEAAGCPSYGVVDPDKPSITAWKDCQPSRNRVTTGATTFALIMCVCPGMVSSLARGTASAIAAWALRMYAGLFPPAITNVSHATLS